MKLTVRSNTNLTEGPILKSILLFALPIMFSGVFQQLYNTVDTMIVGHILGENSLAAIGAASPVYALLINFAGGFGIGINIVSARNYGKRDEELLRKTVANSVYVGFLIAAIVTLIAWLFARPLLEVLNTPAGIMDEAAGYIITITSFTVVTLVYNISSGLLRAVGNSFMPLVFLIISSVSNIALDLLFVGGLGFGVIGAAVATVISQSISAVLCLIYIGRKVRILVPFKKDFTPNKVILGDLSTQGLSYGFMSAIVNVGTVVLQYGINGMGEMVIAGHVAARKLFQLADIPFTALGSAASTFVSQNRGADKPDRIKKALLYTMIFEASVAAVLTVIMRFASEPIVRLVSGSSDAVLISNATRYLQFVAPFYVVVGAVFAYRNSLQGLGHKILPLFSSLIEMAGKILFSLLLIPMFGYTAVIVCEPSLWCLMVIPLLICFYTDKYLKKK